MLKHNVRRKKKTNSQVEYLKLLFHKLGGEWDGKIRKEAMQKTGLSRIQIYKWFFDMKQIMEKPKKFIDPEERISYQPEHLRQASNEELEMGMSVIKPIFLVERV